MTTEPHVKGLIGFAGVYPGGPIMDHVRMTEQEAQRDCEVACCGFAGVSTSVNWTKAKEAGYRVVSAVITELLSTPTTARDLAMRDSRLLGDGFLWKKPDGTETHIPAEEIVIATGEGSQRGLPTLAKLRLEALIATQGLTVAAPDSIIGCRAATWDERIEHADKLVSWALRGK